MNDLNYIINCIICSNQMHNPITIQCGHSFCRACTIKWKFKYHHEHCPICRQKINKRVPNVNINLKQLIDYVLLLDSKKNSKVFIQKSNFNFKQPKLMTRLESILKKRTSPQLHLFNFFMHPCRVWFTLTCLFLVLLFKVIRG